MTFESHRLPPRIAVTGSSGYVGRGLIERLERDDAVEEILAIDVRPPSREHSAKVVFRRHDVAEPQGYRHGVAEPLGEMLREHGMEAVVHLAFLLNAGHRRSAGHRVNVGGIANVLLAGAQAGVSYFLYVSSSTVYGAHAHNSHGLTEEAPVRPVKSFEYGQDKASAEAVMAGFISLNRPSMTSTVLRVCPVMGPNADNFISMAFSKPVLVSVRGYDPPMQLVHEDDLTDVMATCLTARASGVYNVAGRGTIRWSEMAAAYGRRLIPLPAPLLYGLTELTWRLRLQSDSPASGLDFIRYPWTVST